jgi:hypothetical protein
VIPPSGLNRRHYIISIAIISIVSINITSTPRRTITPHTQLAAAILARSFSSPGCCIE